MQTKIHDEQNIRILIKTGFCICILISLTSLFFLFVGLFCFLFWLFLGGVTLPCFWVLVPSPRSNLDSLQWKCRAFTTGPWGNSYLSIFYFIFLNINLFILIGE